jgi:Ca-activated chloride channel homolog
MRCFHHSGIDQSEGRYMKKLILLLIAVGCTSLFADGLLLPSDKEYPKDFLRNRLTQVKVFIHGLVAETFVSQEFVNEWTQPVDAIYNFPLPPQARATEILYWYNDTTYKAVLKVQEQVVNPGTGEGELAAAVNKYIGRNGIKIELKNIPPGELQKIELRYVMLCDCDHGKITYTYPLATGDFVKYPVEQVEFNFYVWSSSNIAGYEIPAYSGSKIDLLTSNEMHVSLSRPKQYLDQDLVFSYQVDQQNLGVDFFSIADDPDGGHFSLFVRPPVTVESTQTWPKQVIFLLCNSTRLTPDQLSQSVSTISQLIGLLSPSDNFNIILYNHATAFWKAQPVPANSTNKTDAQNFCMTIGSSWDSQIQLGLNAAFGQFSGANFHDCILLFSDGRAFIDPKDIEEQNSRKVAVFPIAIGENPDRSRLEMIAGLNYGFVTYLTAQSDIVAEGNRVFRLISQPLMQDIVMEYGRIDLYDILPRKLPATYAGSYFFMTGCYHSPGRSVLTIAGESVTGVNAFDFNLDFGDDTLRDKFAAVLWAKEMIDAMEREVDVYGETPALKDSLIHISLKYNIRCRYTAYIADYSTIYDPTWVQDNGPEKNVLVPQSYIISNYPNPFNPSTTLYIYISQDDLTVKERFIKIYNSLGQLVAVIDISQLGAGFHTIRFDGRDYSGMPLPSGLYFVRMYVGQTVSTLKVTLIK